MSTTNKEKRVKKPIFIYIMSYVYFIYSTSGSTYIGATVNIDKRIRQHNCEIKGGAVATGIKVKKGDIWKYYCYVENFPSWQEALRFEWRWKNISRHIQKCSPSINPIEKRLQALDQLLNLEKSTSKAIPYSNWLQKPNIVWC